MFKIPANTSITELDTNTYNVQRIKYVKDNYDDDRSRSKAVTFALQYKGTAHTLVRNSGFSEEEAENIVSNYKRLYYASEAYSEARIRQAAEDGYVIVAFGLKLRTPLLKKTVMDSTYKTNAASAEGRTAGNALSQSYGLLNCKAANDMRVRIWNSKYIYSIMPIMQIHDAQYYIIPDDIEAVEWFNKNLAECMSWQDLPELEHDVVKLGAEVDLHPNWSKSITLPNGATKEQIQAIVDNACAE